MNVLFASVEMSPLAKVGGLGDVTGSLPRALRALGADVRVAMPMHGIIDRKKLDARHVLSKVKVLWPEEQRVDLWIAHARDVPVYLVQNEHYFERPKIYGYDDDLDRMLFFCDALLACASHIGFKPDVVHAQDWHAAWLLTRLSAAVSHPWLRCGRVYTIHNLALQGNFDREFAERHHIAPEQLTPPAELPEEVAYSGMAQGIMHADRVNTVSETYAKEIMTPEYGAGLDVLLRARADVVSGIVNGIDYDEFNPATDPALTQRYDINTLDRRIENKRALQKKAGLPVDDGALLFGVVTRLFAQKGIDLVADAFRWLLATHDAQLVVLGTGDEKLHRMLLDLQAKHPVKVKVWLDFNPPLGQQIYAGCDVFLMPSRYEPCGLGQLISLRYGAVPLVRRTGGLADTVQDAGPALRSGTGFIFDESNARDLARAAERAIGAFRDGAAWRAMQERGMRQDWSWGRAAARYLALYDEARDARAREAAAAREASA